MASTAAEQDYDLHDDRALPDLQTAINKANTYRNGALHLRSTCLAGIAFWVRPNS